MRNKRKTKSNADSLDPVRERVRRADRIVENQPQAVRRAATSDPVILALRQRLKAMRAAKPRKKLEQCIGFLEVLRRPCEPHLNDEDLFEELKRGHGIASVIVQVAKGESITQVVCQLSLETPAGGGLTAATVIVETANLNEPMTVENKPDKALLPQSLAGSPDLPAEHQDAERLGIPELDGEPLLFEDVERTHDLTPAYLMQAYALGSSGGAGAPLALRLLLDAWRLPASDRDGYLRTFDRTVDEVVAGVWPYGYDWKTDNWKTFVEALNTVTNFTMAYTTKDGTVRRFRPVAFTDWPEWARRATLGGQPVRGLLTLPKGAHRGPSMSRAVLQHAGVLHALALRFVVAWTFYRGKHYFFNGKLAPPSLPRAQQDAAGHYLDRDHRVILDKHQRPITSFKDSRVVLLDEHGLPVPDIRRAGRVPNRAAIEKAPALTLDQWASVLYPPANRQPQLARAHRLAIVEAVDLLVDCKVFEIEWSNTPRKPSPRKEWMYGWCRTDEEVNVLSRQHTRLRLIPAGPWGGSPKKNELQAWYEQYRAEKRQLLRNRKSSGTEAAAAVAQTLF